MTSPATGSLGRSAARGFGLSLVGNIATRLVNVASTVVMAHLIAPEQFGVFAVGLTVWTIAGTIADFGLGSDLVRTADPARTAPSVGTVAVTLSGLLALLMLLTAQPLAAAFGSSASVDVIRLLSVGTALSGLAVVPNALLQRAFRQGRVVMANLAGVAISLVVMILMAEHGDGALALAWGQIAGQAMLVVALYAVSGTRPRFGLESSRVRASLAFCLPVASANLVSWLLLTVDNLIVARALGPVALGFYLLAFNISSWPMSALGVAVRAVALPAFSHLRRTRGNAAESFHAILGPVALAGGVIAIGLGALAHPLIRLVYGSTWGAAAVPLAGLAVFGGLRVLFDLTATYLIATGKTIEVLVVQLVWLAAMVPVVWLGAAAFGLGGAGWAHVVVAIVIVVPAYSICLRRAGVAVHAQAGAVAPALLAGVPAALLCIWLGRLHAAPLVVLAIGGCALLGLYVMPMNGWLRSRLALRGSASETAQLDELAEIG